MCRKSKPAGDLCQLPADGRSARLPAPRIATVVEASYHQNLVLLNPEEYSVWKSPNAGTAPCTIYGGETSEGCRRLPRQSLRPPRRSGRQVRALCLRTTAALPSVPRRLPASKRPGLSPFPKQVRPDLLPRNHVGGVLLVSCGAVIKLRSLRFRQQRAICFQTFPNRVQQFHLLCDREAGHLLSQITHWHILAPRFLVGKRCQRIAVTPFDVVWRRRIREVKETGRRSFVFVCSPSCDVRAPFMGAPIAVDARLTTYGRPLWAPRAGVGFPSTGAPTRGARRCLRDWIRGAPMKGARTRGGFLRIGAPMKGARTRSAPNDGESGTHKGCPYARRGGTIETARGASPPCRMILTFIIGAQSVCTATITPNLARTTSPSASRVTGTCSERSAQA